MPRKLKLPADPRPRAEPYYEFYTPQRIKQFTGLSKSQVQRLLKKGDLKTDPEYTASLGRSIVRHEELIRWMTENSIPVPSRLKKIDHLDDLLTPLGAARKVRVSVEHLLKAVKSGRLPTQDGTNGKVRRRDLIAWEKAGLLIDNPWSLPEYAYELKLRRIMEANGFTARLLSAQCGNRVPAHEIQRLMQDSHDADLTLLATIAGMLAHVLKRPIALEELLQFRELPEARRVALPDPFSNP